MKIHPVEAKIFYEERGTEKRTDRLMDGWTDMTKLTVIFCNFAKGAEIGTACFSH